MASTPKVPSYRKHVSGQAFVVFTVDYQQKSYYLGPHDTPQSRARYYNLIAQWTADRSRYPDEPDHQIDEPLTVSHLVETLRAESESQVNLKRLLTVGKALVAAHGVELIEAFGPVKLRRLRQAMIDKGNSRGYINEQVGEIVRVFKFGVSHELVEANQLVALESLEPLRHGQAKETEKRKPADLNDVLETLKHTSSQVRGICLTLLATGMRPSEAMTMRPADIDTTSTPWIYKPLHHKTEAYTDKAIPLPNQLQSVVAPFMDREPNAYMFSPSESRAEMNKRGIAGPHFTKDSLNRHIRRVCEAKGITRWTPYQLRHLAATHIAKEVGKDAATAALGHLSGKVTEGYIHDAESKRLAQAGVEALGRLIT